MSRGAGAASEYATTVVRLFPDHAGSVLWFSEPVPYEVTRLDPGLLDALRAWEDAYEAGLTDEYAWRAPELEVAFRREAARLARRLADQLGDGFQVQYDTADGHRRVRGSGPARNAEAAAVFRSLADAAGRRGDALRDAVERARAAGATLEWRAD